MADNIRLVTFAGSTVTPQDDALVYETAINQNGIISGGAITLKNNNTLHIAAGHGIICGRKFTIVESDITVLLTTGDTHLGRAYIHLDLSNTTDPIQILTETGSALSAPIQQPDVNISNGIYEIDLATFTIDALTISDLVDLRPTVEKIMNIINELKEEVDNAKVDTLTTMEQVNASTDKTKPVGVGAVQELSESLANGEISFSVVDGEPYVKVGADTPRPFKSGNSTKETILAYWGVTDFVALISSTKYQVFTTAPSSLNGEYLEFIYIKDGKFYINALKDITCEIIDGVNKTITTKTFKAGDEVVTVSNNLCIVNVFT